MKGLGSVVLSLALLAGLLLLYVHGQIALFHISYQIEADSEKLSKMVEEYRFAKFEVDQLKAPRLLEEKMKDLSLNLTLPEEIHVVRVPDTVIAETKVKAVSDHPMSTRLLNMLGRWVDVAQAKTDN